jgi:hypothetical protein
MRHMLTDPAILLPLVDFLSVGDMFRLRRAVGEVTPEVADVVARRMDLALPCRHSLAALSRRLAAGRCVECGRRCRAQPAVCGCCRVDPTSPFAMMTRMQVRRYISRSRPSPRRHAHLFRLWVYGVVKVGREGAFYYWRRDVEAALLHDGAA